MILGAGRFEIQNENTNRVKWVVRRKTVCCAVWRRMGKKNFTRVRVKFKTRREREQNAICKLHSINILGIAPYSVAFSCNVYFCISQTFNNLNKRGVSSQKNLDTKLSFAVYQTLTKESFVKLFLVAVFYVRTVDITKHNFNPFFVES